MDYFVRLVHPNKVSIKNRTRLPLQPSIQQTSLTLTSTSITPSTSSATTTTLRQPKKHKLPDE